MTRETRGAGDVNETEIRREYGTMELTPAAGVVAGAFGTWEITYTVGRLGMDDGSSLKVAYYMTSDMGTPQFEDPAADDYCSVETTGDATVEARYERNGHRRPFKPTVVVDVYDGALAEGEEVTLTLGDRSGGSMGLQAQSFVEEGFRFVPLVDPIRTGEFVRLPDDLSFDVVAGEAASLAAVAESEAAPGEAVTLSVRVEDYWGNVARGFDGTLDVATGDGVDAPDALDVEAGVGEATVTPTEPGVHRPEVRGDGAGLAATANPIVCEAETGGGDGTTLWGDIHGQSEETVGTGTVESYFEFARDSAFLDFAAHAGNDFQITEELWEEITDAAREFDDPGEFVAFPCFEWSANTPNGGDHNVYFRDDDPDLVHSSSWLIADGFDRHEGTYPAERLYEHYEGRDDVLIVPHQGGRPATLDAFDPELTPFLELVSVWGVFEWFGEEALDRGYRVGFVGGSDDHTGRPGATSPANKADFTVDGGLMAARATDTDRAALWDAFESRSVYATTGARIHLDVDVADAGIGEVTETTAAPEASVTVHGTAPLARVDLFRDGERVASEDLTEGEDVVEFTWQGARSRTRHKTQVWDGGLSLDRGRVASVEEVGFDHPDHGVRSRTDTTLRWRGETAGNHQGLRVAFDAPDDAEVTVSTEPVTTSVTLGDLDAPHVADAGHLDRKLTVRRTGTPRTRDVDLTLRDESVDAGEHAYYVRVRQVDGEMAWSSPAFVTVG